MNSLNIRKRHFYWETGYPCGIADARACEMIDINKCRISFETSEKGSDEGYCDVDGTETELRSKTQKVDVLIALSGEAGTLDKPSRKWTQICQPCKYSKFFSYYSFVKKILDD